MGKFDQRSKLKVTSSDESDEGDVWCICRSSDVSRFMIACDKCQEWYHGDCINITPTLAEKLSKFYCKDCQIQYPEFSNVYKDDFRGDKKKEPLCDTFSRRQRLEEHTAVDKNCCGCCRNCLRTHNCGSCDVCTNRTKRTVQQLCLKRRCLKLLETWSKKTPSSKITFLSNAYDTVLQREAEQGSSFSDKRFFKKVTEASKQSSRKNVGKTELKRAKGLYTSSDSDDEAESSSIEESTLATQRKAEKLNFIKRSTRQESDGAADRIDEKNNRQMKANAKQTKSGIKYDSLRQCFGLSCTNAARPDSKYCSDNCGIKLAQERLLLFLPDRVKQWNESPCVAEQMDEARLVAVKGERVIIENRLMKLEEEHQNFRLFLEKLSRIRATTSDEIEEPDEQECQEQVDCVTCASELNCDKALRHMERCFLKMQSNTIYYSNSKEHLVGTPMFCDYYNPQMKGYCKNLRVWCEHTKEPKSSQELICGYPLEKKLSGVFGSNICTTQKRLCNRHNGWERLKKARIDIERYRLLMRLDEIIQEDQQLLQSLERRGSVLDLLLNQTFDHDPAHPIKVPIDFQIPKSTASSLSHPIDIPLLP